MDNFRDSYFQVDWDLTAKRLRGTYWGKQYDTGRGFAVTVINGGQVVAPTTEVLRLKWEKPDNTTGYVNATIVNGKFIVENIDQMFTVHGSVRADFELSVGGEFVASITFYVSVEKAVAVDAIESSSDFTALQVAIATVDSIDAQLAQNTQDLDTFRMNGYFIPSEKIQVPKEIGFSVPIEIKKNGVGVFETNIEPEHLYPEDPTLKTYYIDFTNGSNANDGLTLATAFKNFATARDKPDVGTIMVAEGWYDKDQHTFPTDKSIKVKAIEGHKVVFSAHSPLTFSLHSGNTYKTTRSATIGVWDKKNVDGYGEYIRMTNLTNIVDVENTPNSWYFDSATNTVYVHCFDGRSPDENVMVSVNTQSANMSGDNTYYVEGIQFSFGRGIYFQTLDGVAQPTLLAKDCKFSYSDLENGLNVNGAKLVVLKNCESSNNYKDGFNYHDKQGATGEVIEIGCMGRKNGADGEGNNNGSTAHNSYKIIRIGGWYTENEGPNVADVGNTYSLNIGCTATNTMTTVGNQADFLTEFKMWLDNCCSNGSLHSVQSGSVSSDIKVRNSMLYGQIAEGTGTY